MATRINTLDLVDPELRPLLALFPTRRLTRENLSEARLRTLPRPESLTTDVEAREMFVPSRDGAIDIPIRTYRPQTDGALPSILHIHGGGFVLGSSKDSASVHAALASTLRCAIVSVDYRLAPETLFPDNIEDCYDALAWMFAHASTEGFDTMRIGVMGESAGGGLAASLALLARDRGEFSLAFQHLIYPMLDDRTCTRPPHPIAGEFIWDAHNNHFGWEALLGHAPGLPDISPYAAAARAEDLAGLPPTFIGVGALDLFVDEDLDYARRLNRAGVPLELHVYPGAYHGFNLAPGATVALEARGNSLRALQRFLAQPALSHDAFVP